VAVGEEEVVDCVEDAVAELEAGAAAVGVV